METLNEQFRLGSSDFGSYSNPQVDEVLPQSQQELDPEASQGMINEVRAMLEDDVAYIPPLVCAVRQVAEVRLKQDKLFFVSRVRLDG